MRVNDEIEFDDVDEVDEFELLPSRPTECDNVPLGVTDGARLRS